MDPTTATGSTDNDDGTYNTMGPKTAAAATNFDILIFFVYFVFPPMLVIHVLKIRKEIFTQMKTKFYLVGFGSGLYFKGRIRIKSAWIRNPGA